MSMERWWKGTGGPHNMHKHTQIYLSKHTGLSYLFAILQIKSINKHRSYHALITKTFEIHPLMNHFMTSVHNKITQ